jgi:hypothetical protein
MPRAKQYVTVAAAATPKRVSPAGVGRLGLIIQNTGVNPCLYRFENEVQEDGGDIEILANEKHEYLIPGSCPADALNFLSALGTTLAIVEILEA